MSPTDYRREFAAYTSAVERARFERHAGLAERPDLRPVEGRYADLWSRGAVEDLARALEEAPEQFETERAGLRALLGAARLGRAEAEAREVTEELGRCEGAGGVEWGGGRVDAGDVPGILGRETDAARRRELWRRWLDALRPCDDLRAARLAALGEAVRSLGFDGRRALYESYTGADLRRLADGAAAFLERTEAVFMSRLAAWAASAGVRGAGDALEQADEFFFGRAAHQDAYFPGGNLRAAYAELLAGLGVRSESQRNLLLDAEPRPAKGEHSACFAVNPPVDVRLVFGFRTAGADAYLLTFREAGRAQMFAWASREASARYPEFTRAPDRATPEAHGLLLSGLLRDASWLARLGGLRPAEAREAARHVALLELHGARRDCASLLCALALDEPGGAVRSEQFDETYVSLFGAATGFRHNAATRLRDADEWFTSATRLRARLFAAGMAEHLRGRHGRRWFASRPAGDELIDIWNTAARYSVGELARLVWGGAPDFELLAASLTEGLEGDGV